MIRLAIAVEGETEEEFVKAVLADHLRAQGVEPHPILPGKQGGNISVDRLTREMARIRWNFDCVTSLVDFSGFKGRREGETIEGLLFSDVAVFGILLGVSDRALGDLRSVRSSFSTPEDINDGQDTAPSKRIKSVVPSYRKRRDGPLLAQKIGLRQIRAVCPRFDSWISRLESLGEAPAIPASEAGQQ